MTITIEKDGGLSDELVQPIITESEPVESRLKKLRKQLIDRLIRVVFIGGLAVAGGIDYYSSNMHVEKFSNNFQPTDVDTLGGYEKGELVKFVLAGSENDPNAQLYEGKVIKPIFDQNGNVIGYFLYQDGVGMVPVMESELRLKKVEHSSP